MLRDIKSCYDLQNPSLAKYLGVSIDMINSVLADRRTLDLDQWMAVQKLYEALEQGKPLDMLDDVSQTKTAEAQQAEEERRKALKKMERRLCGRKRISNACKNCDQTCSEA